MEWMKKMGLKKSFLLLSVAGILTSLLVIGTTFVVGETITAKYPKGGIIITDKGIVRELANPTKEQLQVINLTAWIEVLTCVLAPVGCLGMASLLFYRFKLEIPIAVLQNGTERIRAHDLAFTIPEVSGDELGQICGAFETMRVELLRSNQELWRQAEERKRLNAAFSHDLRNPLTVLKGTVKLMKQGTADEHALERMEIYVQRLEQYVEAMSSIQRLEQIPVRKIRVKLPLLCDEVEETARLLAAANLKRGEQEQNFGEVFRVPDILVDTGDNSVDGSRQSVELDHGLFLTVAENLIGNAVRYANNRISIRLSVCEDRQYMDDGRKHLIMTVADDGNGYPVKLITEGPKPFGKIEEDASHFGMGLYTSSMLCTKHGGMLVLTNEANGGAKATAVL
jgi:signal transduction histidine kinase